ncbi:MAG: HEAT repeat domain-containing protein, partial [Candidatus Desantisbacteria bacterium]
IGHASAIPTLKKALEDNDTYVRRNAAVALGRIGHTSAIPALIEALEDEKLDVRRAAVEALGAIGHESAILVLIGALEIDPDWHVRQAAVEALGKIGHASAIPTLKKALEDNDPYVRQAAAEAMEQFLGQAIVQLQRIEPRFNPFQHLTRQITGSLTSIFNRLEIRDLMLGTRQYIKMLMFTMYLEGRPIEDIELVITAETEELRQEEQQYVHLPTTGCEIGLPLTLSAVDKAFLQSQADDDRASGLEKKRQERAQLLAVVFNFFMRIDGDEILGVRPSSSQDGQDIMDLRILPSHYRITQRILELYIHHFMLFTPEELISSSYATTVQGLLKDWRGVFIAAVSFFLDRVQGNNAFTGSEVIPTDSQGLG